MRSGSSNRRQHAPKPSNYDISTLPRCDITTLLLHQANCILVPMVGCCVGLFLLVLLYFNRKAAVIHRISTFLGCFPLRVQNKAICCAAGCGVTQQECAPSGVPTCPSVAFDLLDPGFGVHA